MYTPPRSSLEYRQGLLPSASGVLPIAGSHLRNKHGIEWIVDGHLKTSSLGTLPGDDSELTAYPVIFPQNLSDRLGEFRNEVARCTPKVILPLDTMPTVFRTRAHPGGHSIDAWSHPEHIDIFIDAEDVSEVVLAHELAHAWIDLVRGIEDNRVWREREDTARYAQIQFMQSFVLDFAVDQVLDEKGFDRSQIVEDWEAASAQLRIAAERGYQPENQREAVFMASHLASTLVEEARDRLPVRLADLFPVVSRNLPEIFSLAKGMAQSVLDHFPTDRGTARIAIDQVLRSSFAFTDPGLDFEGHLIHVEPEINWEMDKNPGWLTGQSVRAKCEIGVAMANAGATSADTLVLNRENSGPIMVSFQRTDGSNPEAIPLEHAVMPPDPRLAHINEIMDESRRAKARMEKMNLMNPSRQSGSTGPHLHPNGPAKPNFGPQMPNVPGFRPRSYSPGLARWLTRVRMKEMLAGEHPYGYAENNPITKTDPTGLRPCKPFEALACYTLCASQGARYTGTCSATEFLGIVDVNCHCQPLLPNCGCDAKRLGQLMLQIALTCSVPRKCGPYLAAPPDKKRCPAIIANITLSLGCIYAQDALNKECFGGGDPGHKQKIKEAWNTINTCTKALAFNGCGPYPR